MKGKKLFSEKNYNQAKSKFWTALSISPENKKIKENLISTYENIRIINEKIAKTNLKSAEVLFEKKQYKEAYEKTKKVLFYEPDNKKGMQLAELLESILRNRDRENQKDYYEIARIQESKNKDLNEFLNQILSANNYFDKKEYSKAFKIYLEVLDKDHKNDKLYNQFLETQKILSQSEYRERMDNKVIKTNIALNYISTNRKYNEVFLFIPKAVKLDKENYIFIDKILYFFLMQKMLGVQLFEFNELTDKFIWDRDWNGSGIVLLLENRKILHCSGISKIDIIRQLSFKINYPIFLALVSILTLSFAWATRKVSKTPWYISLICICAAFFINYIFIFLSEIFLRLIISGITGVGYIILSIIIFDLLLAMIGFFTFFWEKS